ncbi:MAG TPA: TlpA disulfide reductase family protein [Pyrinomonadaceae bacterium]|nr:TlpA disulfide reductase family protein [Pyrinomonadaceae bacterium]
MDSKRHAQQTKKFWTPARAALTILALSLLAAFGAASCNSSEVANSSAPPTNVSGPTVRVNNQAGKSAPANSGPVPVPQDVMNRQLTTIDGQSLKLSDLSGKVVVMNLWATWCGPCRIETPELVRMHQEYKAKGVEFLGVTTMENDPDIENIRRFVREQNVDYRTVYTEGSFVVPLVEGRNVIPQSFVISRDGRVLKHFVGFNAVQTPALMREAIDQALNG